MAFRQCFFIKFFFRYTWTDQSSSTPKVIQNLRRRQIVPVGPRNWTKKVSRVTYNTGRDQRSPLQFFRRFATEWMLKNPKGSFSFFFGIVRFFFHFFIEGSPIHHYFDILKSFCYFWALNMAPTWASPGLFCSLRGLKYPKGSKISLKLNYLVVFII